MRAAVVTAPGTPPAVGDFADPEVGPGRELMDVVAAGIHPAVRSIAAGTHYGSGTTYPFVPGIDCVARAADGTSYFAASIQAPWGTLAERVAVPPLFPLPEGADPVAVAGGLNPGMSSWLPLLDRRSLVGELGTVLVLGATGVAGRMAVQNAELLGAARVVPIGRNELREGGAGVAAALDGRVPSTILDFVWGDPAEVVWEALARSGFDDDDADIVHIQIGAAAGETAGLPASLLRSRRFRVHGSGAGSTPIATILRELPTLFEHIASGRIAVPTATYALDDLDAAWNHPSGSRAVVTF